MKKYIVIALLLFTCISVVEAQRWRLQRYRVFFGGGASNYFGDIGGAATEKNYLGLADVATNTTHSSYHLGVLYKLQEKWDVKLNVNHAIIRGSDEGSRVENRGLSFNSKLWEVSGQANYIFFSPRVGRGGGGVFSKTGMGVSGQRLNFHVFAGAGLTHYNVSSLGPEQVLTARREEEIKDPTGITAVIPAGLGVSYVVSNFWEIGMELGGRYTFTNSLDGFSSYYGNHNDIYYITTLQIVRRIRSDRRGVPQFELFRKY